MAAPITEMFTQLPIATNANLTDIIAGVQGYVSPSILGSLNQITIQQVFNLFKSSINNLTWNTVTTSTISMVANNGYIINCVSGLVTLSLPAVSAVGDELILLGLSSGKYTITQLAAQQIIIAPNTTTPGIGGSLSATNQYCAVTLRCMVANTIWGLAAGSQDAFTFV